jgi:hypothetical protein
MGTVRCSDVLIFLSPQTSSRLSWAKPSNTHDFQHQTSKVDASCLHKSLGMISLLSSFLGYDELLIQPTCRSQVPLQRPPDAGVARVIAMRPLPPPHADAVDQPPCPLHARHMQPPPRASPHCVVGLWEMPSLLFSRQRRATPLRSTLVALLCSLITTLLCSKRRSADHPALPSCASAPRQAGS